MAKVNRPWREYKVRSVLDNQRNIDAFFSFIMNDRNLQSVGIVLHKEGSFEELIVFFGASTACRFHSQALMLMASLMGSILCEDFNVIGCKTFLFVPV